MDNQWIDEIEKMRNSYGIGDYEGSVREGKSLLDKAPAEGRSFLYLALCDCALQMDQPDVAESLIRKARENYGADALFVEESILIYKESMIYFYQGQFKKCQEILRAVPSESPLLSFQTVECDYWQGDFAKALEGYNQVLLQCQGEEWEEQAEFCLFGQARCLTNMKKFESAEEILVKLHPQRRQILDDRSSEFQIACIGELAYVRARQEKIPEARLVFHTDLDPDLLRHTYKKSQALLCRGKVRFCAGSLQGAEQDFREVVALRTRKFEKLEAFLLLGDIAREMGNANEARIWYESLSVFPEVFWTKEAQNRKTSPKNPFAVFQTGEQMPFFTEEPETEEFSKPSEEFDSNQETKRVSNIPIPAPMKTIASEELAQESTSESNSTPTSPPVEQQIGEVEPEEEDEQDVETDREENIWMDIPIGAILLGLEVVEADIKNR